MLSLCLDAAVILIYIIAVAIYRKKGFLKSSETILSLILTVLIISSSSSYFESYISGSQIGDMVNKRVEEIIVPESDVRKLENSGLPDFMEKSINNAAADIDNAKTSMMSTVAEQTSEMIIKIIASVLLFMAVKLFLFLLFRILGVFCHFKFLGFINKTMGVIIGLINATIFIYFICALLILLVPSETSVIFKDEIAKTYIAQFFYNENLFLKLFM